ncbi:trifolitoxin immunity protein [Streptomonospora alba]|uniref:Trifolitoxin immunity protein n=1 Tax=Streptomonospora alba TaxID=183763 RepID=A0A0C2FLS4_9ACTN|nr:phosphotransferase [Streptomonospora alba]KII00245.1 trifolitoxin immunity protein [Streptomonospora alba]
MAESSMPGGSQSGIVRIGRSVHRPPTARSGFVRALFALFEDAGWDGAPRFPGTDDHGRDGLSYIEGHVAWEPEQPAEVASDACLVRVAGLVREFHDLTAGSDLAGNEEVVCHNDLAPKNTVYRGVGAGLRPVAFIDWDLAGPGRRIHDVAHVCWQYLRLGPSVSDVGEAARRLGVICDAYGMRDPRQDVVDAILWWQDRCRRGIEAGAAAGDPVLIRLAASGAVGEVRLSYDWVQAHRDRLVSRL